MPKLRYVARVAFDIFLELVLPVPAACAWNPTFRATGMLMPKASMHEDSLFCFPKHYIRLARQLCGVNPVSISEAIDRFPNRKFRLRVLAANAPHVFAAT